MSNASSRQTTSHTSTKGRWGNLLNMMTEQKNEMVFDGDGRPVLEKTGIRGFHVNNPPSQPLTTTPWMYQIWSSVLGQSMTTILPNGTKSETNNLDVVNWGQGCDTAVLGSAVDDRSVWSSNFS